MPNKSKFSIEAYKTQIGLLFLISIIVFAIIISYFGFSLLENWNQITDETKKEIMGTVSGSTLSLGALSLTVLAYSFSEIHSRKTTFEKAPYRRLVQIAYLIIPLSFLTAFVSMIYILIKAPFSFEVSFVTLFIMIIGLVLAVHFWVMEEVFPSN